MSSNTQSRIYDIARMKFRQRYQINEITERAGKGSIVRATHKEGTFPEKYLTLRKVFGWLDARAKPR
jgi:hypothetical protein